VSSLTVEQVIEIRRRYWEESELLRVLAEEFSVGISGIYSIVCNRTWKHLLSNQK